MFTRLIERHNKIHIQTAQNTRFILCIVMSCPTRLNQIPKMHIKIHIMYNYACHAQLNQNYKIHIMYSYVRVPHDQIKFQTAQNTRFILCIELAVFPHDQIKFQTAQTTMFILCIVLWAPTHKTIHNIYYAPFVYIAPPAKNARFLPAFFALKTNYYHNNLTNYFNHATPYIAPNAARRRHNRAQNSTLFHIFAFKMSKTIFTNTNQQKNHSTTHRGAHTNRPAPHIKSSV